MADYHAYGATTTAGTAPAAVPDAVASVAPVDDNVPKDITAKQDEIIQYVAKYVVHSCDAARYQNKIRSRTRHNSYFMFLDVQHPYHGYYQYLLESYRHWRLNDEAVGGTGAWGSAGAGAETEEYAAYDSAQAGVDGQSYGALYNGGQTADGSDAYAGYYAQAPSSSTAAYEDGSWYGTTADPTAVVAYAEQHYYASGTHAHEVPQSSATAAPHHGGAEEDTYQLVMENGGWTTR